MAISDVAFQALLGYQQERQARRLGQYQQMGQFVPQAVQTFLTLREAQAKSDALQRETEARYGTPAVGTPGSVNVGAPPEDPRRRFLGIPMGRAPQPALRVMPSGMNAGGPSPLIPAGDPGTISADNVPMEFLTGDTVDAMASGRPVFYRPPSPNYRPATLGQEELKIRSDLLSKMTPVSVKDLLTNPDRAAAVRGSKPTVKIRNITIDDAMRQRSMDRFGYDAFEGMPETMSEGAVMRIVSMAESMLRQQTKPTASKEGDQLMDEATTRQLYVDEGMTPDQIAAAPKRIKKRDERARRGRISANARGAAMDSLLNAWLGGTSGTKPGAQTSPSDSVSSRFGF